MRKIFYLCGMMLLCMDMMAQIDPYDQNWNTIVYDDFDEPNRQFNNSFQEPLGKWISFVPSLWPSGVTKWGENQSGQVTCEHQIYQWNHCIFDDGIYDGAHGVLKLNAQFKSETPILCNDPTYPYDIPPRSPAFNNLSYHCDSNHQWLYYYSGMIESLPKDTTAGDNIRTNNLPSPRFRYGYFEIRCKLPVHEGAFPAFWLWDAENTNPDDKYYEEIDIFEFSWRFEDPSSDISYSPTPHGAGNPYCFTTGLYYNETTSENIWQNSRARNFPMISDSLTHWHTFSCMWMPDSLIWYCDGNVVNEYYNPDSIPHHHLSLKANYAIDYYAMADQNIDSTPHWRGSDNMIIDYIKVCQLKYDCNRTEIISNQSELENFDYGVKKSIAITSSVEPISIENSEKMVFRATDSFEITGPFQVDGGGEMTVIMQQCLE